LKRAQHFIAAHATGAELLEELNGFSGRHLQTLP
jgi:hypothetical protein